MLAPLLKTQKTQIWNVLSVNGIDPSGLMVEELGTDTTAFSQRENSNYEFFLENTNQGEWYVSYFPDLEVGRYKAYGCPWESVLSYASRWAVSMVAENETPDPWAARDEFAALVKDEEDSDGPDSLFTVEEQAQMATVLGAWERQIVAALETQTAEVGELKLYVARQFEALTEALSTKGRRAWRQMARDLLVNIGASIVVMVGPDAAAVVTELAHNGLKALPH